MKPNIFAAINVTSILINTIIPQNRSNKGDFSIIASIEAGIPITTKKMYIKNVPISFAPLNELKYFGKIEANPTVNVVTSKYLFEINVIKDESPKLPKYLERVKLIATITTAVAKVNAISVTPTVVFEELLCSLISTSLEYEVLKYFLKKVMLGININTKKYNTISKLSLTVAADIKSPGTSNAEETATKFTPPPIYDPVIIPAILFKTGIKLCNAK